MLGPADFWPRERPVFLRGGESSGFQDWASPADSRSRDLSVLIRLHTTAPVHLKTNSRSTRTRLHSLSSLSSGGPLGSAKAHILRNSSGCVMPGLEALSLTGDREPWQRGPPGRCQVETIWVCGHFPAGGLAYFAPQFGRKYKTYLSGDTDLDNSTPFRETDSSLRGSNSDVFFPKQDILWKKFSSL